MALNPTSPVTGATISGLTTPTYTITEDNPPDGDSRKWVITALGGTQTGVEVHSVSSPFSIVVTRPKQFKSLGRINPVTGAYAAFPTNETRVRMYKGATIVSGVVSSETTAVFDARFRIPAGTDLSGNDVEDIKALYSLLGGFLWANAQGMYDLATTGMLK